MTEHLHDSVSSDKNLKTREDIAKQSISNISDAIATVVSHSTNDEFRKTCFSLLEVSNSSSLAAAVSSKLTAISNHHQRVLLPTHSTTQEKAVKPWDQMNSQQSAVACSLQVDQEIASEVHPSDLNDFDLDFNDEDFFDEVKETTISETEHQTPSHLESNVATSTIKPPNSLEVPRSPSIKEDWFDEVLDADLFFNES